MSTSNLLYPIDQHGWLELLPIHKPKKRVFYLNYMLLLGSLIEIWRSVLVANLKVVNNKNNLNRKFADIEPIAPTSDELVLGLVGYAGSGCTSLSKSLEVAFKQEGYDVEQIKFSKLIIENLEGGDLPAVESGTEEGKSKLARAKFLQDQGDQIREKHDFALSAYAIKAIKNGRNDADVGKAKKVFILDSLKHESEVLLLRTVYGASFKLLAVHCDYNRRFSRLYGSAETDTKFAGASKSEVKEFLERDEKDSHQKWGQQVREVFHLADFFVDDNSDQSIPLANNEELKRFIDILLGRGFHRPERKETAMYSAVSASLRSSCLSRQVGAAIFDNDGNSLSIGSNDVPKFGGGTQLEGDAPDNRCAHWKWQIDDTEGEFIGCHNTRHKLQLHKEISEHIEGVFIQKLSNFSGINQKEMENNVKNICENLQIPKVNDLIEFSRSIHAEMDAIFSALRQGKSTVGATLYCTTFPCHNCARHIVTAGIVRVYYIEPYVKSLALSLHSDSITTSINENKNTQTHLEVLPFTGVGPRMYEEYFLKHTELKDGEGKIMKSTSQQLLTGTRLHDLKSIEEKAISLLSEQND